MKKALILIIFIIILTQISLVSADSYSWCIEPVGDDYSCEDVSSLTNSEATTICDDLGGLLSDDEQDSRCVTGCCCDFTDVVNSPESELSEFVCQDSDRYGSGNYVFYESDSNMLGSGSNCAARCENVEGIGSTTHSISGTVVDHDGKPKESVTVYYPSLGMIRHVPTTSDGSYEVFGVPKGDVTLVFKHPECIQHNEPFTVEDDITDGDVALNCTASGCQATAPYDLGVLSTNGESSIKLFWEHDPGCMGVDDGYFIYEVDCVNPESTAKKRIDYLPFPLDNFNYTITQNLPVGNQQKCYQVSAKTNAGEEFSKVAGPIGFLSEYCMAHEITGDFCINEEEVDYLNIITGDPISAVETGVFNCDHNKLIPVDLCGELSDGRNEICSIVNNEPTCTSPQKCELCNGLYGFFTNGLAKILGTSTECQDLVQNGECYLDNNGLIIDTYKDCAYVNSCYDYKTPAACSNNACLNSEINCEWHPDQEDLPSTGQQELGFGICRPSVTEETSCGSCNSLLLDCDYDACTQWMGGDCYFKDENNCLGTEEMYCELYSADDCQGDPLGFGVCKLNSNGDCIKDANNLLDDYENTDCGEDTGDGKNDDCLLDYEAPVTTLTFKDGALLTEEELVAKRPIVIDNREDTTIQTKACIELGTTSDCTPANQWGELDVDTEPSEYTINYFSEDGAGNQEETRSVTISLYQVSKARLNTVTAKSSGLDD